LEFINRQLGKDCLQWLARSPPQCLLRDSLHYGVAATGLTLPSLRDGVSEGLPSIGAAAHATGQASLGSTLHGTGSCKPCAWFWKPEGCSNGAECRHCHTCSKGEIRARKQSKYSSIRETKLALRATRAARVMAT
jgi:hypothetical protein